MVLPCRRQGEATLSFWTSSHQLVLRVEPGATDPVGYVDVSDDHPPCLLLGPAPGAMGMGPLAPC